MPDSWWSEMADRSLYTAPYPARYAANAVALPAPKTREEQALERYRMPGTTPGEMFGKRLMEETGVRDIWDEFARLNDDGNSITGIFKNLIGWGDRKSVAAGAIGQTMNAPLQALFTPAVEINRAYGAALLSTSAVAADTGNSPWRNYLTGGLTPEEQELNYAESAPGVYREQYKPLTAGDLLVVSFDRLVKYQDLAPTWLGLRLLPNLGGPYRNGSYLPASWDLTAPNAGEQMEMAGVYAGARIWSNMATELALDPLNWASGPMNALRKAASGHTLIGDSARMIDQFGSASSRVGVTGTGADLIGATEMAKTQRRLLFPAGWGYWNRSRMLAALATEKYAPLVNHLRDTTDVDDLARTLGPDGFGIAVDSDAAYRMASTLSRIDSTTGVLHWFDAYAFRNVDSIRVVSDVTRDTALLEDDFKATLGLTDDVWERAAFDFAGEQGPLPLGHPLSDNAEAYVARVMEDNDEVRAAWEALGNPERERLNSGVAAYWRGREAAARLAGDPAKTGQVGTLGDISFIPRISTRRIGPARGTLKIAEPGWMATRAPRVLTLDGTRLSRYRPRILLLDKPGLSFNLHGEDAVDKFNDIIRWVDARITSQKYLTGPRYTAGDRYSGAGRQLPEGYRFNPEMDPELRAIRDRFLEAGVVADAPEELRRRALDDLQTLVIRRMAEATGFEPEAAALLADRGMAKGRALAEALNDPARGFTAPVTEGGRAMILAGQAAVERQASNHVPLMDWDGMFQAMYAVRRAENAMINGEGQLISVAQAGKYFGEGSKYANRPLKYVGREEGKTGYARHTIIDLADAVSSIFKIQVLLRLGYTTRNLAEGTGAAVASGMSLLELTRYADLPGALHNAMWNLKTMPRRQIDRWLVNRGSRVSAGPIGHLGLAVGEVDNVVQDRLHAGIAIATAPAEMERLAAVAYDPHATPEMRVAAARALRYRLMLRQRMALGVTQDNIATAGPHRTAASLHAAQHLYHADTQGALATTGRWDTEGVLGLDGDLDRPIRLVDSPTLAAGHVDAQWVPVPTTGANAADRLAAFNQAVANAGGGTTFRFTDRAGATVTTTSARRVLKDADPAHPVTVHQTTPAVAPAPTIRPNVDLLGEIVNIQNSALPAFGHAYSHFEAEMPKFWNLLDRAPGLTRYQLRVGVTGQDLADAAAELADWALKSTNARRIQAVRQMAHDVQNLYTYQALPPSLSGGVQVALPSPSVAGALRQGNILAATHHIQMRDTPNGLWRPFDRRTVTNTTEIRVLDRATHPDFPRVVSVDTWGAELDLRGSQGVQYALHNWTDLDEDMINAARRGDHEAQDRLSEVMAGHGIYRIVLPDRRAQGWGKYQIVVHPRGVGERALAETVNREYEGYIEAAARARTLRPGEIERPPTRDASGQLVPGEVQTVEQVLGLRGGTRAQRRAARARVRRMNREVPEQATMANYERVRADRHDLIGEALEPTSMRATDVLMNGGLEQTVNELVEAAIRTRRNRYSVQALHQQRKAQVDSWAKRRGIRDTANTFRVKSAYSDSGVADYEPASMLTGAAGGIFGSQASGSATHMMGMAQLGHLTDQLDDLKRSMLVPRTITPDDPRFWDALSNLFNRQYRDEVGRAAGGVDNLDPMVAHLLQSGDRARLISEGIEWALHTDEGRQWVRTLGLRVVPERRVPVNFAGAPQPAIFTLPGGTEAELVAAERARVAREPEPGRTRAERRIPAEGNWRADISIPEVNVGDVVTTMSNFLENHVMHSREATRLLLEGGVTGEALRAAHEANPWQLRPVSGLLSPTTAEARALLTQQQANMAAMERFNRRLIGQMSKALNTIGAVPETRLLRHPMFEAVGQADLRQRIAFAENTLGRGLSIEEVNTLRLKSQKFALKKMEQTLYTLSGRSAADDYMRFIAPFFPAWRNAITRWGRMVVNTPGSTFLLTNRVQRGARSLTLVDSNGVEQEFGEGGSKDLYAVMPGAGGLVQAVTGLEGAQEAMRNTYLRLNSMDVIFQGDMLSPGFGPWVAAPAQWLLDGHPEWMENFAVKWLSNKILPIGPTSPTTHKGVNALTAFLPTSMRRLVDLTVQTQAWADEMSRSMLLYQTMERSGQIEPMTDTELRDKAKRLTNTKMTIKLLSALASPVASQQRGDVEFYAGAWRQLRDAYGNTEMANEQFDKLFPHEYLLAATSMSKNLTGGASTSRAVANQKRYGNLQAWAAQNDMLGLMGGVENWDDEAFLTGSASEGYSSADYNPYARDWQLQNAPEGSNEAFRSKKAPEDVMSDALVRDGYRQFDQARASIETDLVQRGLAPGSYGYQKELDARMAITADLIANSSPVWGDAYGKRDETRLLRNEMFWRQVVDNDEMGFITPERDEQALTQSIRRYLDVRDAIRNNLVMRQLNDPKNASVTTDSGANYDLALLLAQERTRLANGSPAFRQWADRYFRHDVVTIDNATMLQGVS